MTVHILQDGNYAVVRCHKQDVEALRTALQIHGFECGPSHDVIDIDSLVDINIKRNGSWNHINSEDIRKIVKEAGLNEAGQ